MTATYNIKLGSIVLRKSSLLVTVEQDQCQEVQNHNTYIQATNTKLLYDPII